MNKRVPIFAILVTVFNILVSVLVNLLTSGSSIMGFSRNLGIDPIVLVVIVIVAVLSSLAFLWFRRSESRIIVKPVSLTLREKSQADMHAHRGLIVLTSLWNAQRGASPKAQELMGKDKVAERLKVAQSADYEALDIEHSPLQNVIRAVETHRSKLEHCWFVCTSARNLKPENSSATYVPALINYFKNKQHLTEPFFHPATETTVSLDEQDAQIAVDTRDKINEIFRVARERYGLQESEIVCDFSGCPRSMVVGLIWACLDKKRDIQFVATKYDDAGGIVGLSTPILYSFEAQLEN